MIKLYRLTQDVHYLNEYSKEYCLWIKNNYITAIFKIHLTIYQFFISFLSFIASFCTLVLEVGFGQVIIVAWLHGFLARLPRSWAYLTILVRVLEGLYKTNILIDFSTNWQIVHSNVSDDTFVIDDVGRSEGHSVIGKASVVR